MRLVLLNLLINDSLKLCYEIAQLTQNKEIYKLQSKQAKQLAKQQDKLVKSEATS
jgi:hypothetical protein